MSCFVICAIERLCWRRWRAAGWPTVADGAPTQGTSDTLSKRSPHSGLSVHRERKWCCRPYLAGDREKSFEDRPHGRNCACLLTFLHSARRERDTPRPRCARERVEISGSNSSSSSSSATARRGEPRQSFSSASLLWKISLCNGVVSTDVESGAGG